MGGGVRKANKLLNCCRVRNVELRARATGVRNGVAELDGKVYSEMAGMVWRARRLRQKEIRGTYKKQPISNLVLSKPAMKSRTEPD